MTRLLAGFIGSVDQVRVEAIAELIESISLFQFQLFRRRTKEAFRPFASAAAGKKPDQNVLTVLPERSFQDLELTFVAEFYDLMRAAHFRVLSQQEWEHSCNNEFTFTNPMEVAWENMDRTLLQQLWQLRHDDYGNAAPIGNRVLVMHRGIKLSFAKGLFIAEKLDLLVLYVIVQPCQRAFGPFLRKISQADLRRWWPGWSVTHTVKASGYDCAHKGREGEQTKVKQALNNEDHLLSHENAKAVERVTLRSMMPGLKATLKHFFTEVTLQEPTFKEAIILYRRLPESQAARAAAKMPVKHVKAEDYRLNMHIKRFQNIPIADLEMIFPDKKVFLKPLLLIQLLLTILVGVISVCVTLLTTKASWSVIGAVMATIGTRAFQVWNSAQLGRQKVLDQITDSLYDQTLDAQDGVLCFLLDQMADQQAKEHLLAYTVLLQHGKAMTSTELDEACEAFVKDEMGESVDFALENSLPSLVKDGLVMKDPQAKLTAVPLPKAHALLVEKGKSHFDQGSTPAATLPTASPGVGAASAGQAGPATHNDSQQPASLQKLGEVSASNEKKKSTGIKSMLKHMIKDE